MLSFLFKVPLIDSDIQEDKILLRDILYNFIHEQHPYQAIDDMSAQNTNCSDFFWHNFFCHIYCSSMSFPSI